jgi:hypothetical protein
VAPIDRQATKDFINKIPSYVAPVDRQATKDFIAKIPSYVDPANRKAVVDAAKEEIVRKICLLDLKKRPLLETKN